MRSSLVRNGSLLLFPCILTFCQSVVVKLAMCLQHFRHRFALLTSRIQAVLESFTHYLAPGLLGLNILLDSFSRDVFSRPDIVRTRPQAREGGTKMRALTAQNARSLELISEVLRRIGRWHRNKEVHVVWHNFKPFHLDIQCRCLLVQHLGVQQLCPEAPFCGTSGTTRSAGADCRRSQRSCGTSLHS